MNGNPKKKIIIKKIKKNKKIYWPGGPVENQLLWPELARPPKKCVRASAHIANVKPCMAMCITSYQKYDVFLKPKFTLTHQLQFIKLH